MPFCTESLCYFDKIPTFPILLFELFVLASTALFFFIFSKKVKHLPKKFLMLGTGVLMFELFTAPMWDNHKMGWWAYLYADVSWILTLGWTTLLGTLLFSIDLLLPKMKEGFKMLIFLCAITPVVLLFELLIVSLGIRGYAAEVLDSSVFLLPPFQIPVLEGLYYIPAFIFLVVSFFRYWSLPIDHKNLVPRAQKSFLPFILITIGVVFLYELVIDPMVVNTGFPAWSYVFKDITLIFTAFWVVVILIAGFIIEQLFQGASAIFRFATTVLGGALLATPVEAWLIKEGYRVYATSATANFTGITTLIFKVPIEVVFAIPIYLVLVVASARYWEVVIRHKL